MGCRCTIVHVDEALVSEDKDVEDGLAEGVEGTVLDYVWTKV